ncbi:hypothetical protein ACJX0J_033595, partial [Zea mays]
QDNNASSSIHATVGTRVNNIAMNILPIHRKTVDGYLNLFLINWCCLLLLKRLAGHLQSWSQKKTGNTADQEIMSRLMQGDHTAKKIHNQKVLVNGEPWDLI